MLLRQAFALSVISLLALSACERKKPVEAPQPSAQTGRVTAPALAVQAFKVELQADSQCRDRCAEFKAEWLHFPQQPGLDAALLMVAEAPAGLAAQEAIQRLGKSFLADAVEAREGWQQLLAAELDAGLNDVSVIDVENYSYTGGAHGMTTATYVNWDRRQNRVLKLADVILPGHEPAFWREAQRAHQAWVRGHDDAASLGAGWPFGKTDNFALKPDVLVLKYQPYAIGPYSEGTPEIRLDYARLAGVLRPEYLPGR